MGEGRTIEKGVVRHSWMEWVLIRIGGSVGVELGVPAEGGDYKEWTRM